MKEMDGWATASRLPPSAALRWALSWPLGASGQRAVSGIFGAFCCDVV